MPPTAIDPRNATALLHYLTDRQFVRPHRPVRDVLADARHAANVCPDVAERALRWLNVDPAQSVGRLRRTQLTQLAQCISRYERAIQSTPTQHA